MKESFDYKEVPKYYVHCLNATCSRAADCLRFLVGSSVDKATAYFTILNPAHNSGENCDSFDACVRIRYAVGISHLYDKLPHEKYRKIKESVYNYFGHSHYYRIYNKSRHISPEGQTFIRELFEKENVGFEPVFDEYVERYNFSHLSK